MACESGYYAALLFQRRIYKHHNYSVCEESKTKPFTLHLHSSLHITGTACAASLHSMTINLMNFAAMSCDFWHFFWNSWAFNTKLPKLQSSHYFIGFKRCICLEGIANHSTQRFCISEIKPAPRTALPRADPSEFPRQTIVWFPNISEVSENMRGLLNMLVCDLQLTDQHTFNQLTPPWDISLLQRV